MLRPTSLVIDTNVWVDYLLGVEPFCQETVCLFDKCTHNSVSLLYTPTTLKDVFYIVPRQLQRIPPGGDATQETFARERIAWACIETITSIATAIPLSLPECNLAWMLRHKHGDLEDDLVVAAAETCGADYIVTYDQELIDHFAPVCITPVQAYDLLSVLEHG